MYTATGSLAFVLNEPAPPLHVPVSPPPGVFAANVAPPVSQIVCATPASAAVGPPLEITFTVTS